MTSNNKNNVHRFFSLTLLLCVLLQSIIPTGYMPENLFSGNGWISICPQQEPELFRILQGDDEHSHHHHHHHVDSNDEAQTTLSCDWASSLTPSDVIPSYATIGAEYVQSRSLYAFHIRSHPSVLHVRSRIRAPPFSSQA